MSMNPVSRETFLQQGAFYSALSSARPDDKIVLIRLPKEMCAADLDGQSINYENVKENAEEEKVIGNISVKLRSKNKGHFSRSNSSSSITSNLSSKSSFSSGNSSVPSTSYIIKSSNRNLRVNSLAITQPFTSVTSSLSSSQQMRLGKEFDEFWSVNLGVEVEETPIKKISKVVKKRAEGALVEQPKNLRMRLLPFSTPNL